MKSNSMFSLSLICGLLASVGTMILWYFLLYNKPTVSVFTALCLLLPAIFGLLTSFLKQPLIIISFVISLPLSLYLLMAGDMFTLFFIASILYFISAALKWKISKVNWN
ncbi:hypothetical protein KM924_09615 [Brevibacillus parabrevis]|uniref:hypothetical protein n=1 Tax=Brevibacillus parabrevis TaxID=54914 RepID=UPI001C24BAB7|nr:hypothetical protein [Brevibacillus parabrevis]